MERLRYVLSDRVTTERFTADRLRTALEDRLEGLAGSAGMLEKSLLGADPTGETMHVLQQLMPNRQPRRMHDVWFDASGTRALLIAETRAAGSDLAGQDKALTRLGNSFAEVRNSSTAQMRYSGPGAMAVESKALITADVTKLSLLSTVLIFAILAWVYRSMPVVLLCAMPALSGLLLGVVAVNFWFGSVHAIALGFGATLLGEAVDYPSYLLTQTGADETVMATLKRMLPMLWLAVATTACGSLPLLMADFPGLAQLGLLTLVGVIVAGLVTVMVLPHLIPATWRPMPATTPPTGTAFLATGSSRRNGVALLVLVAVILTFAWSRPWWDDDLANMNPLPPVVKEQDRQLRESLAAPDVGSLLEISGATQEVVLQTAERLRGALEQWQASGDIGGFDLVSDYLPSAETQASRRAALPSSQRLRANLDVALMGLPFRSATFEPFVHAVDEARQATPLTPELLRGTSLGLKVGTLLSSDGNRWYVVVPLARVRTPATMAGRVAALRMPGVQWIDLRAEAAAMLSAYRRQTLTYTTIGILAIYGVLACGLGSWRRAARVLLPVACALLLTAGTLVAAGQPLTIFHLVALLLTLGIGINYALFFDNAMKLREEQHRTLRTLAVVAGTTLSAFGALALSHTTVLHAIGTTVCLGVLFSLFVSALLLSSQTAKAIDA